MPLLHIDRTIAFPSPRPNSRRSNVSDILLYEYHYKSRPAVWGGEVSVSGARITYTVVSLLCMLLLAILFGTRLYKLLDRKSISRMKPIHALDCILNGLGIAFVLAAAILESGMDLRTLRSCRAAIYVCLVFYISSKVCVQVFLVERAHVIRWLVPRRCDDWIWVGGIFIIVVGFGTIAVFAFTYPLAELAQSDGKCEIGLPLKVTIPLLTYDILINVALTGIFIGLLRPTQRLRDEDRAQGQIASWDPHLHRPDRGIASMFSSRFQGHSATQSMVELESSRHRPINVMTGPSVDALKNLVHRSLIGAGIVLIPTIVNMGLFFKWRGHEQGWLCLTICTIDVTLSVTVVYFLLRQEDE